MKFNFKWKRQTGQYQNGENLYINRIYIASCSWNGARTSSDDDSTRYVGNITLPSLRDKARVYGNSLETIKPKIEAIIINWFKEALKSTPE